MAGIVRREVEILVHTTAPSRGQDDARYRALAQAYLDFEPAEIHRLEDEQEQGSEEDADIRANTQLQEELEHSTLEERESEASYRPDDEPDTESVAQSGISIQNTDLKLEISQGIDSPLLSFNSALDNADSPTWRGLDTGSQKLPDAATRETQQQDTQDSWKELPSEIADSQPENNKTIPAFSSPTRILELYLQQIQSSEERSSSSYGIRRNEHKAVRPSPQLPSGIRQSQSTNSERMEENPSSTSGVPSSPLPQKRQHKHPRRAVIYRNGNMPSTQDPELSTKRKWPESSLDDTHVSSSVPTNLSIESSTVTTRTIRSRKRQCTDGSVDEITKTKEITSSKVTVVATSSAPSFEAESIWAEKSEIRPPPPPTSTNDLTPDMLITSPLQNLVQKMPLIALFRPEEQTRELRPMERGHWIVNCGNWDTGIRKRCWECLGNFIGKGMGGWGVWCIRDAELNALKLYCWGNVVGHTYLLLYMASESKIKGTGACWIGGDGEAVVEMPS